MILDSAYLTVKSGREVGAMLRYLMEHPEDSRAFELKIAPNAIAERAEIITLLVIADPEPSVITLANGQEIVRCRTKQAQAVDVLFSPLAERDFLPCYVFVEE